MKILFAGDTHANDRNAKVLVERAADEKVRYIVQCGDFAYTGQHRISFLTALSHYLQKAQLELWWVEGNHDDYNLLAGMQRIADGGPAYRSRGWTAPNVWHLPRGFRWKWDGVRFLALGGAYSIDEHLRKPGRSWWPEETITPEDVEACGTNEVDVMVTHDSPLDDPFTPNGIIPGQNTGPAPWKINIKQDMKSRSNRKYVQDVLRATNPGLLVHGHLHFRYTAWLDGCRVEGLANDGTGEDQVMVVETNDLKGELHRARVRPAGLDAVEVAGVDAGAAGPVVR